MKNLFYNIVKQKIKFNVVGCQSDSPGSQTMIFVNCINFWNHTERSATPLMIASETGQLDVLKLLICSRAHLDNAEVGTGRTALMLAIENCHVDVARCLVDAGANLEVENEEGLTALALACGNGSLEVVKLLLEVELRAEPDMRSNPVRSKLAHFKQCLVVAHRAGHQPVARLVRAAITALSEAGKELKAI